MADKKRSRLGGLFGAKHAKAFATRQLDASQESLEAVMPRRSISRRGFFGHDVDGGVARFERLTAYMSEQELLDSIFNWERDRTIYLLASMGSIVALLVFSFMGFGQVYFVLGLLLLAVFCFCKALQADFSAWRLRQRRMAAPVEYLNNRLPPNMHILGPNDA